MAKVIAIANQKGGVTKTTTAGAFAAGLKNRGYRVLAIDLDPQGNLSDSIGAEMYESPTVYNLMKGVSTPDEVIQRKDVFDVIPANTMLAGAETEFTQIGKEHILKESLALVLSNYDYIIIDTPPSLNILTVNALTFADEVIIPTTPAIFAANGIHQLHTTILNIKKYCNPNIKIAGILLTKYNPRANINKNIKELTEQLGSHISAPIYKVFIRNSVIVEEAQANKLDIFTHSAYSTVAFDYKAFVSEYLEGELK